MGVEHTPKPKKDPNAGHAFAKGHGHQQEENTPEKEIKVQAHLAQLRKDVAERNAYPTSDLIMLRDEEEAERELQITVTDRIAEVEAAIARQKATQKWVKEEMARNAALDL
jgi:hypothetical protein